MGYMQRVGGTDDDPIFGDYTMLGDDAKKAELAAAKEAAKQAAGGGGGGGGGTTTPGSSLPGLPGVTSSKKMPLIIAGVGLAALIAVVALGGDKPATPRTNPRRRRRNPRRRHRRAA